MALKYFIYVKFNKILQFKEDENMLTNILKSTKNEGKDENDDIEKCVKNNQEKFRVRRKSCSCEIFGNCTNFELRNMHLLIYNKIKNPKSKSKSYFSQI